MASTNNEPPAPELTEAVIILRTVIQKFIEDVKSKRQILVPDGLSDSPLSSESAMVTSLAVADEETRANLDNLLGEVVRLEKQLRSRGDWRPSSYSLDTPLPNILDLADLWSAVRILRHLVNTTTSSEQHDPQQTLSAYSWKWDPAWHEFYTFLPTQATYIYLSQWRLNEARDVWEHVSMAGTDLMPDVAAESLGAWEDWKWDEISRQWYLDMGSENGEKIQLFASPWRIQEDGEWTYVGTI
jgi:hypothetical protein